MQDSGCFFIKTKIKYCQIRISLSKILQKILSVNDISYVNINQCKKRDIAEITTAKNSNTHLIAIINRNYTTQQLLIDLPLKIYFGFEYRNDRT